MRERHGALGRIAAARRGVVFTMLVYGDPSEEVSLAALVGRLARAPARTADERRAALVLAGQVEQAVADAGLDAAPFAAATDALARAWVHGGSASLPALPAPDVPVRVKVPEGFAFYALYPEQYVEAARRWRADHPAAGPAIVVGVRSIGTTLSAVVAATLGARRLTVRPTGDPFDRRVALDPAAVRGVAHALVVDEGPGLSGSSMAAVARALAEAGLPPDRVAFLPGHAGEPGAAASAEARRWWARTPRYVVAPDSLRWGGRSLGEVLAARTGGRVVRVDDLGAGRWRAAHWPDPADWPPAFARFEAPKIRCVRADGSAVLWKFEGLHAADDARARLAARAEWTPPPHGAALGYVGVPWVDGAPLRRADATPAVLARIGCYLAAVAGPPLAPAELEAAAARLRELVAVNAREALGPRAAARARALRAEVDDPRAAGDGRLAPHEWLRAHDGRLVKTDAAGHAADHTVVGRQPLAWDVAGAVVEWGLADEAPLAAALRTTAFHRAAYAALRLGRCALCAADADAAERARLQRAAAFYRAALARALQ